MVALEQVGPGGRGEGRVRGVLDALDDDLDPGPQRAGAGDEVGQRVPADGRQVDLDDVGQADQRVAAGVPSQSSAAMR